MHLCCGPLANLFQYLIVPGFETDMYPVETSLPDGFQFGDRFLGQGPGAGVGGDPLKGGEGFAQVLQGFHQLVGFHDHAIGILEKGGLAAREVPRVNHGNPRMIVEIRFLPDQFYKRFLGHCSGVATSYRDFVQFAADGGNSVYILLDLLHGPHLKFFGLVHSAEGAMVPRTIAGEAY